MAESMQTEVAIVGAGLVGLTAAIALAKLHKKVVLIDAKAPMTTTVPEWDARVYALTENTIAWLRAIGVWVYVDKSRLSPIEGMQLWGPDSPTVLSLSAEESNLAQMGCIIENQNLMVACWQALEHTEVTHMHASGVALTQAPNHVSLTLTNGAMVNAKLIIAADGVHSWVRQQANISTRLVAFDQLAIVANYEASKPHQAVARQWFYPHETLALLPLPQQMVSMVWALPTDKAQLLLNLSAKALADEVTQRSQQVLGELTPIGDSLSFTLQQQTATSLIGPRLILMGDAAHQVHPMAGQGVNLGFKDVMQLCALATKLHGLQDIGDAGFLRQYARARKLDVLAMNGLTSGLDSLFASHHRSLNLASKWGMQVLNKTQLLKKHLIQLATL